MDGLWLVGVDAGTYTVRCTYDASGESREDWTTFDGAPGEEAWTLVQQMPRRKLVAEPVTIEVRAR